MITVVRIGMWLLRTIYANHQKTFFEDFFYRSRTNRIYPSRVNGLKPLTNLKVGMIISLVWILQYSHYITCFCNEISQICEIYYVSHLIEEIMRNGILFQIIHKLVVVFTDIMSDVLTPTHWVRNRTFYVTRKSFLGSLTTNEKREN